MLETTIQFLFAPVLAALSTLAGRRWGARIGGIVSAFPAIVGPVLLIAALGHGPRFAAQAANGTLLGVLALSGFLVAYGRVAEHAEWPLSLLAGWTFAAVAALAVAIGAHYAGSPSGVILAMLSLILVRRCLSSTREVAPRTGSGAHPRREIFLRMAFTAMLVTMLASGASLLGPLLGGMLAALPVLASVLAVQTHRQQGTAALLALLRGIVSGMAGFVAFCQVLVLLLTRSGIVPSFLAATIAAVLVQMIVTQLPTTVALAPGSFRWARVPRPGLPA